ncbi:hypothetical protein Bca52824_017036 [Brassica carinata]|uniref:Uncharacterized protein n=1 Tax=Brassica carinata TaxID=52824 RepID=A0A8X8AUY9_BRACI|nr:hypothetical protein Bca52824_017036 [Brassica carinata]
MYFKKKCCGSDFTEMHPPDLKLMKTENGSCSRGASYSVKGKEIGNNISEDDDKDDNGGPVVGCSGGRSALNGRHSTIMRGQRAQGSRRPGGRRGRGSNCRGGSKSKTQHFKSRCCEEDTDYATDYLCTSRTVSSAYTEERDTVEIVDVNICSSPTSSKGRGKDNNKDNRGMEDDVSCAYTEKRLTGESVDVVLVTPPKQNNKHTPAMEEDDDYVDDFDRHPITLSAEDLGGQTSPTERGKHNNKDNSGMEDDVSCGAETTEICERVYSPVSQVSQPQVDGGERLTKGKDFISIYGTVTSVYNDDDFVDPPVTQGGAEEKEGEGHKKTTCKQPVP